MKLRREIIVTGRFEGFHCWPDAPEEVAFLRSQHRHIFKVLVCFSVAHGDRDREFFIEQRKLNKRISLLSLASGMSCEQYAEVILQDLGARWVEVWEDGENGARVTRL